MEIFPLVDERGAVIGEASRARCHGNPALLHPVVHCIVRNGRGEWLLQKRAANKDTQPGKWDTSVGGHIMLGETVVQALVREAGEEIGLHATPEFFSFLHTHIKRGVYESEFVYTYTCVHEGPFVPQAEEISELRFWTGAEIAAKLDTGIFTPHFIDEFRASAARLTAFPASGG